MERHPRSTWRVVREHTSHVRAILSFQLRRRRGSVLIAERTDGMWATSDLQRGNTTQLMRLTLGMALSHRIKRLYEVDMGKQPVFFTSIFETENEGAIVEGDIAVHWRVDDPVKFVLNPVIDVSDRIRKATEEIIRPIVKRVALEDVESLAEKVDSALQRPQRLQGFPIYWSEAETSFRLTGEGSLHRYSLESIRRNRAVDAEQRQLDRERIEFYAGLISSGQVNLLALMLCNDRYAVEKVLDYLDKFGDHLRHGPLPSDDALQSQLAKVLNAADDFELAEMRRDLLGGIERRSSDQLELLRSALDQPNGSNAEADS